MEQSTPIADTTAPSGPGAKLRQARLDLKLSPGDVANILRLSPRQILALENDDYPSLPGPTYIRGYLRSYAQLLGLAPEKIVENYNSIAAAAPAVDLTKLAPAEQVTTKDYRVKLVSLAVLVIVAGLSIVWWQGREKEPARPKPATTDAVTYQTESGAVITDSGAAPVVPGPAADSAAQAPVDARPAAPVPVPARPAPAASTPMPAPAPVQVPTTAVAPSTPATAPAPQPVPTGPRARLVLRAEQDSWADIRDARQNRLLYETIPAGRVVTLEGVAPISVFLGNVDGVRVEFNGHAYDTAPHKRGPVARFMLGEGASTAQ
jgi:cytoskeleton protein RodZ